MIATLSNGQEREVSPGTVLAPSQAFLEIRLTKEDFEFKDLGKWLDKEVKRRLIAGFV